MKKSKNGKVGKSKYALKLLTRKRLSGSRTYTTTNNGEIKKLPLPLPLFIDQV